MKTGEPKIAKLNIKVTCKGEEKSNHKVIFEEQMKVVLERRKYRWAHSDFAKLIGKYESRNNYNLCNKTKGGLSVVKNLVLSDFTLGEIQKKQKDRDLFAVGRYQIIPITMKGAVKSLNLKSNMQFDEDLQDRIFEEYLIDIKRPKIINYLEGNGSIEDAMYSTAKEWASVAVEKGKNISKGRVAVGGQSYYVGDGLNKAHISTEEIKKALTNSKKNNN